MPDYAYRAFERRTGRETPGTIAGATREEAASLLKARGLAPIALSKSATSPRRAQSLAVIRTWVLLARNRLKAGRTISRLRLAHFTRQLSVLVKAGIPLLRGLEMLSRPERNAAFKSVILDLAEVIQAGGNLSDGLARHPGVFAPLYVSMVRAGEAGGVLDTVLRRLALLLERNERLRDRVKSALTYPAIILGFAACIVTGLMFLVIPRFEEIFAGLLHGQQLPGLTRLVVGAGHFLRGHLPLALVALGLTCLALRLLRRTAAGARGADWLLLRAPLLGDLFLKSATARIARTFGTLLSSGVPILDALHITRDTSGNVHISAALQIVHDRVRVGASIAASLESARIFPDLVPAMISVGEETGALAEMLGRVADEYDDEVDQAVGALTSVLEPVMIVVMAGFVGGIVIALFLPIVGIIQHLQ